ncbi:MAG: hypothetical protein JO233_01505 [Candidatus Eremiobacteraeota bacterium]|nr:hypothetical protein [Candidatus Eremiobacteraeota bacterium]
MQWKSLFLTLCAMGALVECLHIGSVVGIGGRPWFGYWDALPASVPNRPYVTLVYPRAGGASAAAGMREGDWLDLRDQSLDGRVSWLGNPTAARPTLLVIHRGSRTFVARVVGSTIWEGTPLLKIAPFVVQWITAIGFLGCAFLITLRRASSLEARILALILLLYLGAVFSANPIVATPNPYIRLIFNIVVAASVASASVLLILLASRFGRRYRWRSIVTSSAYAMIGIAFCGQLLLVAGIYTLWFDPLPYFPLTPSGSYAWFWTCIPYVADLAVAAVAFSSAFCTDRATRARTAWLLLPLPLSVLLIDGLTYANAWTTSWLMYQLLTIVAAVLQLAAAGTVTYALLKRRVLDLEFVLGRAFVVATVSLIVVCAFVLLEWLLGAFVAGASHASGLIANGALALVLGLSLRYIHRHVDASVDTWLFRRRHENERAILEFSQEAAYMTNEDALLDQTIAKLAAHTDARTGSVLLSSGAMYAPVRSFCDGIVSPVDENDAAILALKAWRKPLDPHRYESSLRGALAIPMVARGRLIGLLLLGERAGGEAYAPDEVE